MQNLERNIKVHDKSFEIYKSKEEISLAVKDLANKINQDYNLNGILDSEGGKINKKDAPIFIVVLSGAFVFAADLLRNLNFLPEVYFVKISSYHGTESGELKINLDLSVKVKNKIRNRDVIVVEDILDTGKTLNFFLKDLEDLKPKSLKTAVFLHKFEMTRFDIKVYYLCFKIPNKFVLGYGLDYDEVGRNLPDLYVLKD